MKPNRLSKPQKDVLRYLTRNPSWHLEQSKVSQTRWVYRPVLTGIIVNNQTVQSLIHRQLLVKNLLGQLFLTEAGLEMGRKIIS